VRRGVYGAADPKAGACGSVTDIAAHPRLNHRIPVTAGVLADECAQQLKAFFQAKRKPPSKARP
jgi:tRNA(adenine34) deaminase